MIYDVLRAQTSYKTYFVRILRMDKDLFVFFEPRVYRVKFDCCNPLQRTSQIESDYSLQFGITTQRDVENNLVLRLAGETKVPVR